MSWVKGTRDGDSVWRMLRGDGLPAPGVPYRRCCPSVGAVEWPTIRVSGEGIGAVPGQVLSGCQIQGIGDVTWMPRNEERFRRLPGSWR